MISNVTGSLIAQSLQLKAHNYEHNHHFISR